jgi:hypothetical protein
VVCVKHCPSTVDYSEFICFDEVQDDADGSDLEAWKLVAKQKCLFKAKTRECA